MFLCFQYSPVGSSNERSVQHPKGRRNTQVEGYQCNASGRHDRRLLARWAMRENASVTVFLVHEWQAKRGIGNDVYHKEGYTAQLSVCTQADPRQ